MPKGFQEAVACLRDVSAVAAQLSELTSWEVLYRGDTAAGLLAAWGLERSCRGYEIVLGAASGSSGYLRLLELEGVDQVAIRSNPQSWDMGGYLDLNVRVADMPERCREFCDARWYGTSDPVQWTFGDKLVSEWLTLGPDGLAFALIERLAPPLEPGSIPGNFGHLFNSSQVVADMGQALYFYEKVLGFNKLLHICRPLLPEPGENPLGIPHNLVSELDVEIAILSPSGEMDGSVELIRMHGLQGRDFSANAQPPNLGILSLRFPVDDVGSMCARLLGAGHGVAMPPVAVKIEPYGDCLLMALQAPDGAWLEFFQPV